MFKRFLIWFGLCAVLVLFLDHKEDFTTIELHSVAGQVSYVSEPFGPSSKYYVGVTTAKGDMVCESNALQVGRINADSSLVVFYRLRPQLDCTRLRVL